MYLAWDTSNKGAPDYVEGVRPGPVRGGRTRTRWSSGRRELVEMTGSLEQLAGLKEKEEEESGSSVHGSENCLREY